MTKALARTGDGSIAIETIERYMLDLGERSQALAKMDLAELRREALAAEMMAELASKYAQLSEVAEQAQWDLDAFALEAKRHAGLILEELRSKATPKGRGKGSAKSPRAAAAAAVGIKPDEAKRYVELAKIEPEKIEAITQRVREGGERLSLGTVLRVSKERISEAADYRSDEWYTPNDPPHTIIDSIHKVFKGPPDEDPASCAVAQMVVRAKRWFCGEMPTLGPNEKKAGLTDAQLGKLLTKCGGIGSIYHCETGEIIERAKRYAKIANAYGRIDHGEKIKGKVFLNPPYAFPSPFIRAVLEGYIGRTIEEAATEYAKELKRTEADLDADEKIGATWRFEATGWAARKYGGSQRIKEAIILVNVAPGTAIQQHLLAAADECWFSGRVAFRDATGTPRAGNRYEQVAFYLGTNWTAFAAEFSRFGQITRKAA